MNRRLTGFVKAWCPGALDSDSILSNIFKAQHALILFFLSQVIACRAPLQMLSAVRPGSGHRRVPVPCWLPNFPMVPPFLAPPRISSSSCSDFYVEDSVCTLIGRVA
jgi:hypothetical protein